MPLWSRPCLCCSLKDNARPTAIWPSWFCITSSDEARNCSRPPSLPPVTSLSFISTAMVLPEPAGKVYARTVRLVSEAEATACSG
ncbi:hypothetical protein D3C85_1155050 [compost metagenome]